MQLQREMVKETGSIKQDELESSSTRYARYIPF